MMNTEKRNPYTTHLDKMSVAEIIRVTNSENMNSVMAVERALPEIEKAINLMIDALKKGGRIYYSGAGTSGRLAVQDAVECPPTFGADPSLFTAIMAGGKERVFSAAESVEDNWELGSSDFLSYPIQSCDVLIGISAAGNAGYVLGAMDAAKKAGCTVISLTCNKEAKMNYCSDVAIVTDTGPEVLTGSTRMKAGNAQKMVLNMLSTTSMIKMGGVYENMMVHLRPYNIKIKQRMINIVCEICKCTQETAENLLNKHEWSIEKVIEKENLQ